MEEKVEFMKNKIKVLFFLLFWILIIFSNLRDFYAEELTIQPGPRDGKDSYISKWRGEQQNNFGNRENIYIGYYDCKRGLLQFNLSSIPPDASISTAELYLYLEGGSYGYHNKKIYVHRITNFWKEKEVTWKERYRKERWNSPGGDFDWAIESSVSLRDTRSGWISWDVTRAVKDWFNGKYNNFGFLLRQDIYDRGEIYFLSSDTEWQAYRPRLEVSYKLEGVTPSIPSAKVYPNPFKPTLGHTEVKFVNLPSGASVKIFHIEGRIIRTLKEKDGEAKWDVKDSEGNNVSSGFYLYRIEREKERQTGKIVIIR